MENLPRVLVAPREILVMHLQLLAMLRNYLLIHVGAMPTDLPAMFWWKLCSVKSEWAHQEMALSTKNDGHKSEHNHKSITMGFLL